MCLLVFFCFFFAAAPLVKPIPFQPNDPSVSGPDIFQRLIPMEAHTDSSLYRSIFILAVNLERSSAHTLTFQNKRKVLKVIWNHFLNSIIINCTSCCLHLKNCCYTCVNFKMSFLLVVKRRQNCLEDMWVLLKIKISF